MAGLDVLLFCSVGFLFTALVLIAGRIIKLYYDEKRARQWTEAMSNADNDGGIRSRNERRHVVIGGRRVAAAKRRIRYGIDADDNNFRDHITSDLVDPQQDDELMIRDAIRDEVIGKKKLAKLQAKAERKQQREAELLQREERRKKEQKEEERLQKQREREKAEAEAEQERNRLQKEEQDRKEEEEYQKLKEEFQVDEEGFDEVDEEESRNLLKDFEDYIKQVKVVNMDELGAFFNLKTEDAVDRLHFLLENRGLTGIMDDRGKFIHITDDELQAGILYEAFSCAVARSQLDS